MSHVQQALGRGGALHCQGALRALRASFPTRMYPCRPLHGGSSPALSLPAVEMLAYRGSQKGYREGSLDGNCSMLRSPAGVHALLVLVVVVGPRQDAATLQQLHDPRAQCVQHQCPPVAVVSGDSVGCESSTCACTSLHPAFTGHIGSEYSLQAM
jgi:hypothetical protein